MEILFNPITLGILTLVILIFSAILHEIAHGYVADRLGDPTARIMGRLTLNPKSHIDPFLSIILPLILYLSGPGIIIGGAKPVPVDPFNLKDGRKDVALVSLAGPLTNIAIAIIASLIFRFAFPDLSYFSVAFANLPISSGVDLLAFIVANFVHLNVILAVFNLLPIPPLDGSKVLALVLPERYANAYLSIGSMGMLLIFFLLMFPVGGFSLQRIMSGLYMTVLNLLGL